MTSPTALVAGRRSPWGLQASGVFYALIAIPLIFGTLTTVTGQSGYVSVTNLSNVLDQSVLVGVMAIFMTVVLISGNFDLSVASTAALSAVIAIKLSSLPMLPSIVICLGVGAVVGLINGIIVQYLGVNAFITTLATGTALRGIVFLSANSTSITANLPGLKALFRTQLAINFAVWVGIIGGLLILAGILLAVRRARRRTGIALIVVGAIVVGLSLLLPQYLALTSAVVILFILMIATWAILRFTVVGRRLYAVGSNPEAARLAGISVDRYRIVSFVLSGMAAAFAGLIFAGRYQSMNPQALSGEELIVITAAILGGTSLFGGVGNVIKSVIGALILTSLDNGMNFMNVDTSWQGVISGAVLVGAAAIYTLGRGEGGRVKRAFRRGRNKAAGGSGPVAGPRAQVDVAKEPINAP